MADNENSADADKAAKPKKGILGGLIWMSLGVLLAGTGFSLPYLAPGMFGAEAKEEAPPPYKPAFIPFGETTVNLGTERFNRFLRVKITLQVDSTELEMITTLVTERNAILKNWLLSYLYDMGTEQIRGKEGQNRLRREIQDYLNTVLFDDGVDRIHDVLFEEFMLQ